MRKVGAPNGIDVAELKRDIDAVFENFKRLCNNPEVRKDNDRFARVSVYLSAEEYIASR